MVVTNQPDIVIMNKQQHIGKKEHEKLEKYQGVKEELERAWKAKAAVVPVVMGALAQFKTKLRSFEETEKLNAAESSDRVMKTQARASKQATKANARDRIKDDTELVCFKCGIKGHRAKSCRQKTWCSRCKTDMHKDTTCRRKEKLDGARKIAEDGDPDFAFKVRDEQPDTRRQDTHSIRERGPMVDTGATSHIITDETKFKSFQETFKQENHSVELADAYNLTHGDIIVATSVNDGILRNAVPCTAAGCLWPKNKKNKVKVPYEISNDFTKSEKKQIKAVLKEFRKGVNKTCIQFIRKKAKHDDYISFISDSGCYSYLGRQNGGQPISLQRNGCLFKDIIQHEALHALGFHHEHVRSDRDNHVTIHSENIRSGLEHNFAKVDTNNLGTPYDFQSVMHYTSKAFSKNGQPTISAIDPDVTEFGTAEEMSVNDYARVNALYEC
nr:high choriolytic enzyme 2-like [Nerophis lumbriciformis]